MVESSTALRSTIPYGPEHPFPLENIPFGAFHTPSDGIHCCTRIGDTLLDLAVLEFHGALSTPALAASGKRVFGQATLNEFIALGKQAWHEVRVVIQALFTEGSTVLQEIAFKDNYAYDVRDVKMSMPLAIGDYTDFYSSKNHAYNVGVMFRGHDNALQPNWLHLPVGYHGRASSVVISGTDIRRPKGQISADQKTPIWSQCKRLDFELEVGAVVGKGNNLGHPIKLKEAADHIFGFTLLNDWSARDLQAWEYVPLGPFNAKNFSTTISPWIITAEALEPFKVELPKQEPEPLPYLREEENYSYDVEIDAVLQAPGSEPSLISKSNFKYMYWSSNQQLTHHSVTGCNMNVGDLLGSGTISGTDKSAFGSLLELSWGGKEPLKLPNGEERTFLNDGDTLSLEGRCRGAGFTIGFGPCTGTVLPALEDSEFF